MDKIHIRELTLRCIIGINEEERHTKQDVVISITMHASLEKACETDDFTHAIDYKSVKLRIVDLVENSSFYLIEALAESVAQACLGFARVEKVDVVVEKPGALRFVKTVGVEISRSK